MKQDIKYINRRFITTLMVFILIIVLAIVIAVIANLFIPNDEMHNIRDIIYFVELIILLFVVGIFRSKLTEITSLSYLIKISSNQAEPLLMKNTIRIKALEGYLRESNFIKYSDDESHFLFYKVKKDNIKKIFNRYMLEIVVYVKNESDPFYLDVVDTEIERIQNDNLKKHKKISHMLITQFKSITDIDDKTRKEIKEIIFVKSKYSIISTINIGLHNQTNMGVLLYSDTYSPSLYYKYHIEQIKKMI